MTSDFGTGINLERVKNIISSVSTLRHVNDKDIPLHENGQRGLGFRRLSNEERIDLNKWLKKPVLRIGSIVLQIGGDLIDFSVAYQVSERRYFQIEEGNLVLPPQRVQLTILDSAKQIDGTSLRTLNWLRKAKAKMVFNVTLFGSVHLNSGMITLNMNDFTVVQVRDKNNDPVTYDMSRAPVSLVMYRLALRKNFEEKGILFSLCGDFAAPPPIGIPVIPVWCEELCDYFVNENLVQPYTVTSNGVEMLTAPLAINQPVDLLSLGFSEELASMGLIDRTDELHADIRLQALYVSIGVDVLKLNVINLANNTFSSRKEDNVGVLALSLKATMPVVGGGQTHGLNDVPLVTLREIVDKGMFLQIHIDTTGFCNTDTGIVSVSYSRVIDFTLRDSDGSVLNHQRQSTAIKEALSYAVVFGYDLKASRRNFNRRS